MIQSSISKITTGTGGEMGLSLETYALVPRKRENSKHEGENVQDCEELGSFAI